MFWRGNPAGGGGRGGGDWPRNGALLKGVVVDSQRGKYLRCTHIKQKGKEWAPVASPEGSFMPFVHSNSYRLEEAAGDQKL